MDKRLPLALLLSFLILFGWSWLHRPEPGTTRAPLGTAEAPAEATPEPARSGEESPDEPTEEPLGEVLAADAPWEEWLELGRPGEAGHYQAHFSNRGARLEALRVDGYYDSPDLSPEERAQPEHWVQVLASLETPEGRTGSLLLGTSPSSQSLAPRGLDDVLWRHEVLADEDGRARGVRFRYAPGTGVTFEKTIRGVPGSYELEVELVLTNDEPERVGPAQFIFVPAACVPRESDDAFYVGPKAVAGWSRDRDEVKLKSQERMDRPKSLTGPLAGSGTLSFAGVHDKYFAALLHASDESTARSMLGARWRAVYDSEYARRNPSEQNEAWRQIVAELDLLLFVPQPEREARWTYTLFAGPKAPGVFTGSHPHHDAILEQDLGFFDGIASLLLSILGFFERLTGNWGWAIILLTLTVRAILFPLNRRSQTAMARHQTKMKRVQPKLDEVKKRWENNPQRLRQEQARVMQEEGAFPPLAGCLPVFLQIPVFFGLFSALRASFDLRQAPFHLWIHDLSKPDRLLHLGFDTHLPFIGTIEWLNVLPPLMVVLWILQQRVMPKPTDEQSLRMYKMMMWMPVLFGFFLYNYAAGLSLYMITQSGLGIAEQTVIKRIWPIDTTEQPKKKSRFMARLAEMQEQAQRMQKDQQRGGGSKRAQAGRKR